MTEIHRLIRSKRRTLALIVERDGTLTVRAPLGATDSDVRRFVVAKKNWIERKQAEASKDSASHHQYVAGETFLYLGQEIPLYFIPDQKPALVLDSVFMLAKSMQSQADCIFETWYKQQARAVLTGRVKLFAHSHGFKFRKIRISSARTRWGSCSRAGTLSFTWRLVMAPLEVIDYVVVHELCHLKEMNHFKAFWTQVETFLPDFKERRAWLKQWGYLLKL